MNPSTTPSIYVLLAGLPGTGKSTLATAISIHLPRSVILNKDTVRAALFPGEAADYSEAQNNICMQAMLAAAAHLSKAPEASHFILFDGRTFSRQSHIDQVVQSAEAAGAAWRILYLWCADETAIARIQQGESSHPAKDRNASLYRSLKQGFEPIGRPHFSLDTGRPLELCMKEALAWLQNKAALDPLSTPSAASQYGR